MKVDMHLHSKFSKRPSQWVLQKLGCPESFTDPMYLYHNTRKLGMSAMTLTDHNTISGCLEIAHLPNTFISEEVTTYFPDDGCKAHVLVYDIDEAIHQDIQKHRENIYDLVAYLNQNNITHALAHPLYSINDRLSIEHFEKFLLLFKTFELNGAREESQNNLLQLVLENLSRKTLEYLTNKHGYVPRRGFFWKKGLIGGSDDHSSLNIARMHSEVSGAKTMDDFLSAVGTSRCQPIGSGASPRTLAHNLYGIAYQYFNTRFNFAKGSSRDVLFQFLNRMLDPEHKIENKKVFIFNGLLSRRRKENNTSDAIQDVIQQESEKAILGDPVLAEIVKGNQNGRNRTDEVWFSFVNQVCNKVIKHFGENLYQHLLGANVFDIFGSAGAAGSLYALMAPYFVSYSLFGRDRVLSRQIQKEYVNQPGVLSSEGRRIKVAHFTDTYYEINGVALTLRQQARLAERLGKDLTIITCGSGEQKDRRVLSFQPIKTFELPEYPEQKLFLPPFLEMLNHVYEGGYGYIHSSTPGPIGLAALQIARLLNLPISGTYHTAIPQYAAYLTGDETIEQLTWRYTLWYYGQMRTIYVPSEATGQELAAKGIDSKKIMPYPRGVDTVRFNPSRAGDVFTRRYKINNSIKLLYVGRVSKEKNMPLLVDVFEEALKLEKNLHLVMVGDGPYLEEMKKRLAGKPCTFTGYLQGEELAEIYASSDIFIFPSTTDTFGNVILEAQASGLPVIVTDMGGPFENIIAGKTGLAVKGNEAGSLVQAVVSLAKSPDKQRQMSIQARAYAENRSFERAFQRHWDLYLHEQYDSTEPRPRISLAG